MDNTPLVSIIIPTYGGSDYLPRAINGVLKQKYTNWELIIVDDNGYGTTSQKKTESVLKPFLSDLRIRYIYHESNKNGSAARNTGVANSRGEYIALLDDDDEYEEDFLNKQVELLVTLPNEYALVYCSHVTMFNDECVEVYHASHNGNLLYDNLVHQIEIATTSILIRKFAYESVHGFDESFRRHQDWEFLARISSKYLIKANDFIGYKRYLELRNVPSSAEKAKEYREHYLEKMKPYISTLTTRQQKKVFLVNKLDVALWFLKERRIRLFFKEYREIRPGWYGVKYLLYRLFIVISRRRFKLV